LVRAKFARLRQTVTVKLPLINSGNNAQFMSNDSEMRGYYQRRVPVYRRVYAYPE
jgi:hypothetical protein